MKKILLLIMCFLFVGVVNAKTLSIEEVIDGFNNSTFIKPTNESADESSKVTAVNNTDASSIDIYVGEELSRSYSYSEGYIHFTDNREITEENANDQLFDLIYLSSLFEGVITKSGFDVNT